MLLPRPFTLGLFAYLRQAGLSLDRAPREYRKAMIEYYEQHFIPFPARVLAELDRLSLMPSERNAVTHPQRRVRLESTPHFAQQREGIA